MGPRRFADEGRDGGLLRLAGLEGGLHQSPGRPTSRPEIGGDGHTVMTVDPPGLQHEEVGIAPTGS
jgi:hypothetical protein